jgi:predicted regulator of Ras-like GTPase activity (Roadblock/LC7/MglB family)
LQFFEDELGIEPGQQPPATLGAAAVKKFKQICKDENYPLDELLGLEWVGTIDKGRRRKVRQKIPDFRDHEGFFADCYHGGRNEAYFAGFTPEGDITDIDIRGAYTTAMAAIRTPDWRGAINTTDIETLAEPGDHGMGFARVRFRFPDGTRFPCLPIRAGDAGLIYPRSGISYATGPELVVARRLGATIEVEHGVFVPWLDDRWPFLQFTEVINTIRKAHDKGSALELAAKEVGNSCYGKVAQGTDLLKSPEATGKSRASGKRVWNSREGSMTTLPPSAISNPALAAFTTGLARAYLSELLAAVPPAEAVYTATTDGLLTEATLTDLQDTGPLAAMFKTLRELVAGKPATLEVKGRIEQALIVKTRGTFTAKPLGDKQDSDPIMARAGFRLEEGPKVEPEDDTPKAREAARRAAAWEENDRWVEIYRARNYDLIHHHKVRIDLRTQWLNDADLVDVERSTRVNLDPDLKRKPVRLCEREGVLAFETEPWDSLEEFLEARDALEQWKRSEKRVLRTLDDFHAYRAWAHTRPAKKAANTRGARPPFITAVLRAWRHTGLGLPGPAGRGRAGGEKMADLARNMTAAGFPISRTSIDNTRRQELRLGAFASLTDTEVDFLRWAVDRWPTADFQPLAVAGSPAADIIGREQEEVERRRAEGVAAEVSGDAPADANASQRRPPYSRKDALRTVPQGGGAPSTNGLNNHDKSNASLGLPKPIEGAQVRTMGIVRSRGTEHSRKPEELYTEIERLFEGPRCEFFARERRPVWDSWGLKAAKFDTDSLPSTLTAKE